MLGLNTECRSKQKKVIAGKFDCNKKREKKKNIKRKQKLQAAVNRRAVSANFHNLGWTAQDFMARLWLVASNYCNCFKYYQNGTENGWNNHHHHHHQVIISFGGSV